MDLGKVEMAIYGGGTEVGRTLALDVWDQKVRGEKAVREKQWGKKSQGINSRMMEEEKERLEKGEGVMVR